MGFHCPFILLASAVGLPPSTTADAAQLEVRFTDCEFTLLRR